MQYSSRLLPCSVSGCPHDGHSRRRLDLALVARPLRRVEHAGHERDHVAGAAHEHRVADPHVARADHLLVGERGPRDRRAADEHRLEHGDRRHLADLADVPDDVGQHGGLLLGRELVGERAARAVGARAGGGVRVAVGEPEHGAVEVVVEVVALRLDRLDHLLRRGRVLGVAHVGGVEAERLQGLLEVGVRAVRRCRGRTRRSAAALGHRRRVLGAHRARGGVARVDQRLVGMLLVVGGERRAQHHRLAADLDAAAGVDLVRHAVGQRAHEHGHVVAGRPVAARDRAREPPALVDDRERQAVELGHDDHRLAGEAVEERLDLLGLRRLLERQHRPAVADRGVQDGRRADLLERVRVGREVGVLGDQRAQLVLERVVVGVGDERLAAVVGVAQLGEAGCKLSIRSFMPPGSQHAGACRVRPGCRAQRAVERGQPVGEAAQAGAAGRVGAADAVVADLDGDAAVQAPDGDRGVRRLRVLGDVGQRLGDHEVGRALDRSREPLVALARRASRAAARASERLERGLEPAVGEHRRVDAARQLAQLLEAGVELLLRLVEQLRELAVRALARRAQQQGERHEPRLGAVVQVALEPPALGVAGLHDPCPRRTQLLHELRDVLRNRPPRNANGVSQAAMKAAQQAASPAPARATVTSRKVSSAVT